MDVAHTSFINAMCDPTNSFLSAQNDALGHYANPVNQEHGKLRATSRRIIIKRPKLKADASELSSVCESVKRK